MENLEFKKEMALSTIRKVQKLIQIAFFINVLFFCFSVFHTIWICNSNSYKLFISSIFIGIIILVINYVYNEVKKIFKKLIQNRLCQQN